jgi:hypothetical protein
MISSARFRSKVWLLTLQELRRTDPLSNGYISYTWEEAMLQETVVEVCHLD